MVPGVERTDDDGDDRNVYAISKKKNLRKYNSPVVRDRVTNRISMVWEDHSPTRPVFPHHVKLSGLFLPDVTAFMSSEWSSRCRSGMIKDYKQTRSRFKTVRHAYIISLCLRRLFFSDKAE